MSLFQIGLLMFKRDTAEQSVMERIMEEREETLLERSRELQKGYTTPDCSTGFFDFEVDVDGDEATVVSSGSISTTVISSSSMSTDGSHWPSHPAGEEDRALELLHCAVFRSLLERELNGSSDD